jgi:hypothetical protein
MDQYSTARKAYHAYGKVTDFKNFRGEPMPEFDALPEKIKEAWLAATNCVKDLAIEWMKSF